MVGTEEKTNGAKPDQELAPPVSRSLAAKASSAHSRINISLNLDVWKVLPDDVQADLTWFHQWILDNNIGWKAAEEAIGYDQSTIFRILKGTYAGSWENVMRKLRSFRDLEERRGAIQKNSFVENSISKIVFTALDYALANTSFTTVVGESQIGKSAAAKEWKTRTNHGRSVYITAPAVGGAKGFLRRIAEAVGVNRSQPSADMADAIHRSFNPNRILIVDQAHWLLPADPRSTNPSGLNFLLDLYEVKKCAIALLSTHRLTDQFKKGDFMYEQIVGRTGMPWIIPKKVKRDDILPIVVQFVKNPSKKLLEDLEGMANQPGRIGLVVQTLKSASRIANTHKERLSEEHIRKAIAFRTHHSREEGSR
jgi:DNA transposition AAA+ family ATPase